MKKQDKRNWPKAVIQILSFLLIPGLFEAQFSAVGTIISAVYQGTVSWERIRYSVWMVLATVPAVIIVGRFFCGYFCSFGAVQDFLWFAGNKLKKRFRKAGAKNLHSNSKKSGRNVPTGWIKYGVLLFWAVFVWSGMIKWNIAGPWQVFGQYSSIGHWPGVKPMFSIGGALILVIFVGSVLIQHFFCRYLCPMGAIYSLISRCTLLKIVKPRSKCGNCHLCTAKCTMGIDLTEKEQMAGGECIGCGVCVNGCLKNNAHWKYRYSVWIGVGVTCLTIAASQFLIRSESGSVGKTAGDAAINTAEQNLDSRFQDGTYSGSGEGYRGTVTVSVKVEHYVNTKAPACKQAGARICQSNSYNFLPRAAGGLKIPPLPLLRPSLLQPGQRLFQGGLLLNGQQLPNELVGHQEALGRQIPAAVVPLRPALALVLLQLLLDGIEVHEELPAVLPLLDAPGGAQAEHQIFAAPLPLGDQVGLVDDGAPSSTAAI